jgi:hypothetical protein
MTSSSEQPAVDWRWLTPVLRVLAILIVVAFGAFAAKVIAIPPHGDELFYIEALAVYRSSGWLSVLRSGMPLPYVVLLNVAGAGILPTVIVGRALSILSAIAMVVLTRRWCESTLRLSNFARLLVTATLCAVLLTQREPSTMAIADAVFALTIVATLIGMERAVTGRRPGLASASGAGWAIACLLRPLGLLYSPAIVLGLAVLARTRPSANRAWRTVAVIVVVAAAGLAAGQAPSIIAQGRLAWEQKPSPYADVSFTEVRYLSLLQQAERGRPPGPFAAQVSWSEVRRYRQEHGAESLPRTIPQRVLWSFRDMPVTTLVGMVIGTTYVVLRLGGVLALLLVPMMLSLRRVESPAPIFHLLVSFGYISALALVVNVYFEPRWFYGVSCVMAGLSGLAFDRLAAARPTAARAVAMLQAGFLTCSLAAAVLHSFVRL